MNVGRDCNSQNIYYSLLGNLQNISKTVRTSCRKAGIAIVKNVVCPLIKYTIGLVRLVSQKVWDGTNVRDSDVVLVLYAKHDWNGALYIPHPSVQLKIHAHKEMKVIYKEVSSIADINDAVKKIKDQNNRIKNLMIHAHGCPRGMHLDETKYLHVRNVKNLKPSLDRLEKGASIIFASCQTGYIGSDHSANIAQSIASQAPHTKVFAPLHSIAAVNFDVYWQDDTLRAKFSIPQKSEQTGILGKLLNTSYFAAYYISLGTLCKQSDTGVFQHFGKSNLHRQAPEPKQCLLTGR